MPLVTVFTPAYNRGYNIRALYEGLVRQTDKDFEWLVINDGSTDDTLAELEKIQESHNGAFPIRVVSRENRGLMASLNQGLDLAEGKLFWRLDSDDLSRENAVELIHKYYPMIADDDKLCALVFLAMRADGSVYGTNPFETPTRCDFTMYRARHKAEGDRAEVMKTEVFRRFKFPKFGDEKFCLEHSVWNRIAREYDAVYIPEGIYTRSDAGDSITANLYKWLKNNCVGTATSFLEVFTDRRLPFAYRWRAARQYYRFSSIAGMPLWKGLPKGVALAAFPFGMAARVRDLVKYGG